jgi:hypothetical protein
MLISSLWHSALTAQPSRSYIFVVDISEKMAPYMFNIRGLIFACADQANQGDNLSIITFSDRPERIVEKRISSQRDRESFEYWLNAMETEGEQANIRLAVALALDDVKRFHRRGDKSIKGIIVISSSQSPEPHASSDVLETALDDLSEKVGEREWYIQYCYLNGVCDSQIQNFVATNRGLSYDVNALQLEHRTDTIEELYRIISSPEELCPITLRNVKGILLGRESSDEEWTPLNAGEHVPETTELRVAANSRAVLDAGKSGKIGLESEADVLFSSARRELLTGKGYFDVTLHEGAMWMFFGTKQVSAVTLRTDDGVIDLTLRAGSARYFAGPHRLSLSAFAEPFSVKTPGKAQEPTFLRRNESVHLDRGRMLEDIDSAGASVVEKWKSWERALANNVSLEVLDFVVPEVVFPEEMITAGPLKSGDVETQDLPIEITGVADGSQVKLDVEVALALPDGLAVSTGIVTSDDPTMRILQFKVDGSRGFDSKRADTYPGLLNIVPAENSPVMFEKVSVPLTIKTRGDVVPLPVLLAGGGLIALGVIAGVVAYRLKTTAAARPRPHSVIGRLISINDPTGGRIGTINMEELGTKSSRLSLLVGRDRAADVRLRHASVSREHCAIEAHLVGGRLETFIEPIGSAKTEVDGEIISFRTRLSDGSRIKVGEFVYQFEDSQLYKKVEVMRRNGRRISGYLDVAGMDAEGFRLSPMDAVSPSERARVKFSDIRYVIFYRRAANILAGVPRQIKQSDTMKKIELMFRKGNTISGYVRREYTEGRRKFVELIPLDPNSDVDYTVIDYSFVVEKRTLS